MRKCKDVSRFFQVCDSALNISENENSMGSKTRGIMKKNKLQKKLFLSQVVAICTPNFSLFHV